jgi:flagellum-specific ATP synthase
MPKCNTEYENKVVNRAKSLISQYTDMEDMIRIGAYKSGSDPQVDEAIKYIDPINKFISQNYDEKDNLMDSYSKLAKAIDFDEKIDNSESEKMLKNNQIYNKQ